MECTGSERKGGRRGHQETDDGDGKRGQGGERWREAGTERRQREGKGQKGQRGREKEGGGEEGKERTSTLRLNSRA